MTSAQYHAESAEPTLRQIDVAGLTHRVLGGGRIRYVTSTKTLTVYGYSMGYPWPNGEYKNELVAQIIKTSFPHLNVEWSNEGY
jgi:phosphohistidine phosphatase